MKLLLRRSNVASSFTQKVPPACVSGTVSGRLRAVERVDVIVAARDFAVEHVLAGAGGQRPPAARGPAVTAVIVAEGELDLGAGRIADAKIRPARARCSGPTGRRSGKGWQSTRRAWASRSRGSFTVHFPAIRNKKYCDEHHIKGAARHRQGRQRQKTRRTGDNGDPIPYRSASQSAWRSSARVDSGFAPGGSRRFKNGYDVCAAFLARRRWRFQ